MSRLIERSFYLVWPYMRTPDARLAQRRREQIINAALACFVRHGFHGTGMKAICEAARMSPGAVYRYFPSKADIIQAIVEGERRQSDKALQKLAVARDFPKALLSFVGRLVGDACKSPDNILATEIFAEACRDDRVAAILQENECALVTKLAQILQDAQGDQRVDFNIKAQELAQLIVSLSYGVSGYLLLDTHFSASKAKTLAKAAVAAQLH
ncbi:TetR/AcrR family transcriptional regulator [Gilvimarinus sp. SDUM040013]|uniref:TetR/AcrR family transcriptional regulator n=1 Tax=Gilvimarinus gilvus TaxID=3058038 RepID=A0ABU4RVL6_9GAMM|nr:TetR/AcrR family transcriptional regulator [Gilvimarinus sp. SDUM040013]MDO3387925.1 TetR/AcrR family transcriptional regulator [Gilvimarinus sp. SDUM040013]MDX6848704.1 TetR/AcrR family transcriptional regulator [Gilvimarinus sp. SDUM040013]